MTTRIVFICNTDGWMAHADVYEDIVNGDAPIGRGLTKLDASTDLAEQYLTANVSADDLRPVIGAMRQLSGRIQ